MNAQIAWLGAGVLCLGLGLLFQDRWEDLTMLLATVATAIGAVALRWAWSNRRRRSDTNSER